MEWRKRPEDSKVTTSILHCCSR
uniref:Uncharacterized protein n=1 Tax=Rhizophora mucronata TaxID=61149 RepID=A0A2P2QTM5_RHIMU